VDKYSTDRVLVTEWVQGQHLSYLPPEAGLRMTRMAIEACTASLVLTGYVHADPHEGNLMLADDGRIIFLDFGLMSVVEPTIMEAFASGIQAALSEDYVRLARAFKDTGFVTDPVQYKASPSEPFQAFGVDPRTGEDLGLSQFADELAGAMQRTEGGSSRFGALATVLNQELAPSWKMFTPPYILLLIRTFLTLEGLAARVDPDFNIYEMAMPWAMRRSLSPESAEGIATLRGMLLTNDDRVQWQRLLTMFEEAQASSKSAAPAAPAAPAALAPPAPAAAPSQAQAASQEAASRGEAASLSASNDAAKTAAMNDAVGSLLGSRPGSTLRRALSDLDSTDLIQRLVSPSARQLRRAAALALSHRLADALGSAARAAEASSALATDGEDARPISAAARRLRTAQQQKRVQVVTLLVKSHLSRQLRKGWSGGVAIASLVYLALRIALGAVHQTVRRSMGGLFGAPAPGAGRGAAGHEGAEGAQ